MKQSLLSIIFSVILALTGCSVEIPDIPDGTAAEESSSEMQFKELLAIIMTLLTTAAFLNG